MPSRLTSKRKLRRGRLAITGFSAQLSPVRGTPYYRVRLRDAEARALSDDLRRCAALPGRRWFTLIATHERPERLRLTEDIETPAFEAGASAHYARGEAFVIQGKGRSCNIRFSGRVGAGLLADRLDAARGNMQDFVEIRIPSRHRDLIEFVADAELAAGPSAVEAALGAAGAQLAARTLAPEDFSDWERAGV